MPLAGTLPWVDQDIVLYHGTSDAHVSGILQAVDETLGEYFKDFGRGFYTTTKLDLAVDWANVKARRTSGLPAVLQFTVPRNDLSQLDWLVFVRGDVLANDYWSFVQYCRTIPGDHNRAHAPWYDVVGGPVTGKWKDQTIIPDADQISFHTARSTRVLDHSLKARIV